MIKPRLNIDFSAAKRRMFINANNVYSPNANEFLFNHNRSAILFILNFLNISGKNVAVMAYNCHTVMNAIHQAGGFPIFIDVDKSLKMDIADLKKKSNKVHIDAIIVTHLFGIPNDIVAIRDILDVPIIEDCAHAYLSPGCGEMGDFAAYSIGQGKFPSIGDGGICVVNNKKYLDKFNSEYDRVERTGLTDRVSLYIRMTIRHFCYKPFIYSIIRLLKYESSVNVIEKIKIRRMDRGISSLYSYCLTNIQEDKKKQQITAKEIIISLESLNVTPLIEPETSNCFMLPIECEDKNTVHDFFINKGIESATHFGRCIEWAQEFGYKSGDCPNSEFFTKHLLVVPTYL